MLIEHQHRPGCSTPAIAGTAPSRPARRTATWALWAWGIGLLLAAIALLTG